MAEKIATLADFGEIPRWIAEWCLTCPDLDGFAIQVLTSDVDPTPSLAVYLYRGERTAGRMFSQADMLVDARDFRTVLARELNLLTTRFPSEDR